MKATISYKAFEEPIVKTILNELNVTKIHKRMFVNHYIAKMTFTIEDFDQLNQIMYCLNRNTKYGVFLLKTHWSWSDIGKIIQEVFKYDGE